MSSDDLYARLDTAATASSARARRNPARTADGTARAWRTAQRDQVAAHAARALADVGVDPATVVAVRHVTETLDGVTVDAGTGTITNVWAWLTHDTLTYCTGWDPDAHAELTARPHVRDHGAVTAVVGTGTRSDRSNGHAPLTTGLHRCRTPVEARAITYTHGGDHHEDIIETDVIDWVIITSPDGPAATVDGHRFRSAHTVEGCDHCGIRSPHPLR